MTQLSTLIQGSGKNAIDKRSYIATSGQTVFAVIYSPPYVDVYQNGVRLNVVDYTATSGTSVTLTAGAALNDEIELIGFASDASITASFSGPTAPAVPIEGMMWYDTTDGSLYIRTGNFWVEASQAGATQGIQGIQGPPGDGVIISGITVTDASYANTDDTAVSLTGGYIKVTGTGFVSGCTVVVGTVIATSVTFISSTEVRAQLPALAAGTYILYVSNPSGAVAIRVNAITFSALPTWVSTSPLPNGMLNTAISIQLSGTSDSSVVYALQSGSTLPTGLTLSSSGLLSGTVTGISSDTTFNFTVVATDAELQDSPKAFSITITATYAVARSLRLRSSASAYLNRTPAGAGNRTTWTMSMWVKRGTLNATNTIFSAAGYDIARFSTTYPDSLEWEPTNLAGYAYTPAVYRDPAAWYHIVFVWDSSNATAANRMLIYVNGVSQTITFTVGAPAQNTQSFWNSTALHQISSFAYNTTQFFDGEMAEVNFVDGQALTPASFGQVSVTSGAWVPKFYAGTYGTNGFCLKFADNSANTAAAIGKDSSTNGNNWTPTNISLTAGDTYDSLIDSPTPTSITVGNYAVLNPLQIGGTTMTPTPIALSNGNLSWSYNRASTGAGWIQGTIAIPATGKWYYEYVSQSGAPVAYSEPGIMDVATIKTQAVPSVFRSYYGYDGTKASNGTYTSYGAAAALNDIITVAIDMDNGALYFGKNGTWLNSGVPTSGASKTGAAFTDLISAGVTWVPMMGVMGDNYATGSVNFGQQPWQASIPAGYLALNTFNLPASAVPNPAAAMAATIYTGTGATRSISNANNSISFQPDLVWVKARVAGSHNLIDSVRGVYKTMFSDATTAEQTYTTGLTAFNSDGFSLGISSDSNVNINGNTYVAWQWKAGGTAVANTSGTITSSVSANKPAGFSVVTYTGNGVDTLSGVATVGHGLGAIPHFIITKKRSSGGLGLLNWSTYHISNGNANLWLNTTSAKNSGNWNTAPTANVFTPPVYGYGNENGETYVNYCWAPVAGYSKFGTYTGNASTDGPFIYTGFRPRWVMIKSSTDATLSWLVYDSTRNTYNATGANLRPNVSDLEGTQSPNLLDFVSNGFKIRGDNTGSINTSATYIYAAFAEVPLNFANAR